MATALTRWLIFIHVLFALTFYMSHGTSVAMAFKLRKETDFDRICAMPDLSWSTMIIMGLMGITLPFMIHIWNKVWIWASIVLMVFVLFIWRCSMKPITTTAATGWLTLYGRK